MVALDFVVTSDLRDFVSFLGVSLVLDFLSELLTVSREKTELVLPLLLFDDLLLLGVGGKTSLAYFDVVLVGVLGAAELLLSSCAFSSLSGVFVIVRLLSETVLTESPISIAVTVQSGFRIKLSTLREISGVFVPVSL